MPKKIQNFYSLVKLLCFSWLILILSHSIRKHDVYFHDLYCFGINFIPFAICVGLLFFSFFLKNKEKKINLEISFFSFIFSFFLLESLITLYEFKNFVYSQNHRVELHEKLLGKPVDKRSKVEVINQFKENNINVFPYISPYMVINKNNDFFPVNSISNSTLIACKEGGEWVNIISDKYGFRNKNEKYNQKIDSVFIGDSYTWGSCVKDNQTIQAVFDRFNNSNSLNFGNVGNGPFLALASLKEFGISFSPKSIFYLFFDGNDFPSDLNHEKKKPNLLSYLEKDFNQNLINRIKETDNYYKKIIEETPKEEEKLTILQHFKNFFSIKNFFNLSRSRHFLNSINIYTNQDFKTLTSIFKTIKETATTVNSKVYFVYLPSWSTASKTNKRFYFKVKKKIINLSKEYFETIDMTPIFLNSPDYNDFFYYKNSHYNEKGYKLVAKTIADKISSENQLNNVD